MGATRTTTWTSTSSRLAAGNGADIRGLRREAGRPVLLLHGFASSPRALRPLERHLQRALGRPVLRIGISPGGEDLRDSARGLAELLEGLAASAAIDAVDVVAHSMGGLVASYLLKRLDRGRRVRRVVTLGTPHRGTPLASAAALVLGSVSRALVQMRPGSALVRELEALAVPAASELVSISGGRDLLVPDRCAALAPRPRQWNLRVDAANHWSLLFARPVLSLVVELLSPTWPRGEDAVARAA